MKQNNLRTVFKEGFLDIFYVWGMEMRSVLKDAGVLIFFVLVPLAYPLVYAFIYTNETVREVPVVAVDASHSSRSREFLRRVDGTADVHIVGYAANLEEAKRIMREKGAYGSSRDNVQDFFHTYHILYFVYNHAAPRYSQNKFCLCSRLAVYFKLRL